MNSKILNALGMQNIDPMIFVLVLLLVCIILLILIILQNGKIKKLTEKYEKFMRGKDMESMEELIMKRFDDMDKMLEDTEKNVNDIKTLFDNMKDTVQKSGVVKYDAFNEMGGKLSFALAMLDGNNTGFVINSMLYIYKRNYRWKILYSVRGRRTESIKPGNGYDGRRIE